LGALVTAGQQNDQLSPSLFEIHPVTGAIVDSQFRDTFTNGFNISGVSSSKSLDPCLDARSRLQVMQAVEPLSEVSGFANFNHTTTVVARLQIVNVHMAVLRYPTNEVERHPRRRLALMAGEREICQRSNNLFRACHASRPVGRSREGNERCTL